MGVCGGSFIVVKCGGSFTVVKYVRYTVAIYGSFLLYEMIAAQLYCCLRREFICCMRWIRWDPYSCLRLELHSF